MDAATEARVRATLDERLAEIEAAVQRLPGLIGSVRRDMRRHLNAAHVATARRKGVGPVRDSANVAALVRSGDLVQLPDSSRWWVLRELDQSLPYVRPDTRAGLEEIGRRFQARLDEHGLPPFRLDVTSDLRTSHAWLSPASGRQLPPPLRRDRSAPPTADGEPFLRPVECDPCPTTTSSPWSSRAARASGSSR